jgi:hypothetical protein
LSLVTENFKKAGLKILDRGLAALARILAAAGHFLQKQSEKISLHNSNHQTSQPSGPLENVFKKLRENIECSVKAPEVIPTLIQLMFKFVAEKYFEIEKLYETSGETLQLKQEVFQLKQDILWALTDGASPLQTSNFAASADNLPQSSKVYFFWFYCITHSFFEKFGNLVTLTWTEATPLIDFAFSIAEESPFLAATFVHLTLPPICILNSYINPADLCDLLDRFEEDLFEEIVARGENEFYFDFEQGLIGIEHQIFEGPDDYALGELSRRLLEHLFEFCQSFVDSLRDYLEEAAEDDEDAYTEKDPSNSDDQVDMLILALPSNSNGHSELLVLVNNLIAALRTKESELYLPKIAQALRLNQNLSKHLCDPISQILTVFSSSLLELDLSFELKRKLFRLIYRWASLCENFRPLRSTILFSHLAYFAYQKYADGGAASFFERMKKEQARILGLVLTDVQRVLNN